jgi:uncharacterized membrane protein
MRISPEDTNRSSTGWDPHVLAALGYLGGCISGLVLLGIEKESRFVRFHAMQSTITFLVVAVAALLIRNLPVVGAVAYWLLVIGVCGVWFFLMFKALSGEVYKLPFIGDLAEQRVR